MAGGNGNNGGDLDFAATQFKAADKLRRNLEPSEYKHVALGLIFLMRGLNRHQSVLAIKCDLEGEYVC